MPVTKVPIGNSSVVSVRLTGVQPFVCPYKLALALASPLFFCPNADPIPAVVKAASTFPDNAGAPAIAAVNIASPPVKPVLKPGPLTAGTSTLVPKAPLYKSLAVAVFEPFVRFILIRAEGANPPNVVVAGNVGSAIAYPVVFTSNILLDTLSIVLSSCMPFV